MRPSFNLESASSMHLIRKQRGAAAIVWLLGIIIVSGLAFGLYVWLMLTWSYSEGERAGWIQKLSKKGWLCKTWEGEMAMVSLPGSLPEKFAFTVYDNAVADQINGVIGKRVALHYEEHIGLPTSCFGDTRHFVKGVKSIEESPAPLPVNPPPAAVPQPSAPAATPELAPTQPKQ